MANTKDSLEKPKRKPGRPKKDREKQAADIAEMEKILRYLVSQASARGIYRRVG